MCITRQKLNIHIEIPQRYFYIFNLKLLNMAKPATEIQSKHKQISEVDFNCIFREHVKKEKRHAILNENFDFNPKKLFAVTEKPTKAAKFETGDVEQLRTKLETLSKIPKQKFKYAMTSN